MIFYSLFFHKIISGENFLQINQKYHDVVWILELSVQQVKNKFEIEYCSSIEDFPESVHLAGADLAGSDIYHHAKCIEHSHRFILWGYTAKGSAGILEQFFPDTQGNLPNN